MNALTKRIQGERDKYIDDQVESLKKHMFDFFKTLSKKDQEFIKNRMEGEKNHGN